MATVRGLRGSTSPLPLNFFVEGVFMEIVFDEGEKCPLCAPGPYCYFCGHYLFCWVGSSLPSHIFKKQIVCDDCIGYLNQNFPMVKGGDN